MFIVIGSGPASIATAYALSKRNVDVCIVDVGNRLEADKTEAKQRLGQTAPNSWNPEDIAAVKQGSAPTTKGLPKKLLYGSDFVYSEPGFAAPIESNNAKVMRSFAQGGLSNVWGACALPYPEGELAAWPEDSRNLDPHYRAISELMPLTGRVDGLEKIVPTYTEKMGSPQLSRQATALLADMEGQHERLAEQKIHYGTSRVAMRNTDGDCHNCGMCLYGCPYDLIYSSAQTLPALVSSGVKYRGGVLVTKIEELENRCRLGVRSVDTGKLEYLEADRVFVGAGVWGTAELMLRSLGAYDTDLLVRHSDRFTLPFLRVAGVPGVKDEALNTLSQLFVEIDDRRIAPHSVHLQVYTYNDMMRTALLNRLGGFAHALEWPVDQILARLLILFGYVHSDSSQSLRVRLTQGSDQRLVVNGHKTNDSNRIAWRVAGRILKEFRTFRGLPAWPMMDPPGGGNHTGGSFPMADNPSGFQTDVWGRVAGLQRTHIVDASTFPSLPAATVLYPSMANAHRIASTCEL